MGQLTVLTAVATHGWMADTLLWLYPGHSLTGLAVRQGALLLGLFNISHVVELQLLQSPHYPAQTCSPPLTVPDVLQGALLLGLFNISHVVESQLSRRAQGDLTSLFDQIPSTAVVVDLLPNRAPDMSTASTQPASSVPVGAHMLVRPGQQVLPLLAVLCTGDCGGSRCLEPVQGGLGLSTRKEPA